MTGREAGPWSFYISAERQNLTPRSGAIRTLDRSHTAYAVGYDLPPFGLAGLCPAGPAGRPVPLSLHGELEIQLNHQRVIGDADGRHLEAP